EQGAPGPGALGRGVRPVHRRARQAGGGGSRDRRAVAAEPEAPGGMTRSELRLERLESHDPLRTFDSGHAELDGWLRRHGLAAQQMDSARTFLLTEDGRIIGYFS